MNIEKRLFLNSGEKFQKFNSSLIPSIDKETVIAVKTPKLKAIAKDLCKYDDCDEILKDLPHIYFKKIRFTLL